MNKEKIHDMIDESLEEISDFFEDDFSDSVYLMEKLQRTFWSLKIEVGATDDR